MVDLKEALTYIDPSSLDYLDWLKVGMGLKSAAQDGYPVECKVWDDWSQRDFSRYQPGVCERKWNSFNKQEGGVSKNTIISWAMNNGYKPFNELIGLDFDDEIDDGFPPKKDEDFHIYLNALFNDNDLVSIVSHSIKRDDGKYSPADKGFSRSAKELISDFIKYDGEIENVIGDYDRNAGAWIRINPVDGRGVSNENITDYRYTLIESDQTTPEEQLKTIYKLRLPCAAIVYSGGKSIHAIVKVEAKNLEEYNKRVKYIYDALDKKGFSVDKQNKNPARLSRLPSVYRGHEKQFLIDIHTGYSDFATWQEYVENDFNDIELPEIKNFKEVLNNMPELAPELIEGVLRQGHKMLLAGSSKAGKSFSLIELGVALAEGGKWFGFKCRQSKVLYINLEIDEASFMHRIKNVYEGLDYEPKSAENLRIWSLRGKAQPMQKLTPKIIKRIQPENYDVIILDPVYKVQSGDENAAGDIAAFTNEFDRLTTELGVSLIYCHHHSKGNQGGKRAIDRASGSGVFARDPDAILDMIELDNQTYQCNEEFKNYSAWRIEGTLREFPPFEPVNVFFKFPVHVVDPTGLLENAEYKNYTNFEKKQKTVEDSMDELDQCFDLLTENDTYVYEADMAKYFGIGIETLRKRIGNYNNLSDKYNYRRRQGKIYRDLN